MIVPVKCEVLIAPASARIIIDVIVAFDRSKLVFYAFRP